MNDIKFKIDIEQCYVNEGKKDIIDCDIRFIDGCGGGPIEHRIKEVMKIIEQLENAPVQFRSIGFILPEKYRPENLKDKYYIPLKEILGKPGCPTDLDTYDVFLDYEDYAEFVLKDLHHYIRSEHVLVLQWDCEIVNWDKWTDDFLKYDFVHGVSEGMEDDDLDEEGSLWDINGGFTLRSKKFLQATDDYFTNHKTIWQYDSDTRDPHKINEDHQIWNNRKVMIPKYDLKFAPFKVCDEFCVGNHNYEVRFKNNYFGYHDIKKQQRYHALDHTNPEVFTEFTYKSELKKAMEWLSEKEDTLFLGQSVSYSGNSIYGTLDHLPEEKRLETPVFEEVQMGMSMGMAMNGMVPISCFPRMDFLMRCMDSLVNHLDKIQDMSYGSMRPRVIIRTAIGSTNPLDGGVQHTQNYIKQLKDMLTEVHVVELKETKDIFESVKYAYERGDSKSTILVEHGDFYVTK